MNKFLSFLFSLCLLGANAQQAALNLSAPDSCSFKLFIDDQPANLYFCNLITLQGLEARKTLLRVEFVENRWPAVSQSIVLKPNTRHDYFIQLVKGSPKIAFSGESAARSLSTIDKTVDISLAVPPAPEIPLYSGKEGCQNPLTDEDFDSWMGDVDESTFQSQKTEQLTKRTDITCIRVEQLVDCLNRLDSEENKLQVLKHWASSIFDTDNSSKLTRLFILKANQEKARQLLGL
jgi:Domain of unknown function (DUF4476)